MRQSRQTLVTIGGEDGFVRHTTERISNVPGEVIREYNVKISPTSFRQGMEAGFASGFSLGLLAGFFAAFAFLAVAF